MEEHIQIPTQDSHIIHCVLNYKQKGDRLIVFVHGLSGSSTARLPFNAKELFVKKGFSVVRIDLYSSKEKGRKLEECSLSVHAQDISLVLDYFKDKFSTIYVMGHSLAGPSILLAELGDVDKVILFDPSLDLKLLGKRYTYDEQKDMYYYVSSTIKYIGKEMYEDFGSVRTLDLLKGVIVPTKVILAEHCWAYLKKEIDGFENKFIETCVVKGASHSFDEEGKEEEALKEAMRYLD